MSLDQEDVKAIAVAIEEQRKAAMGQKMGRFTDEEAEWVHTGAKYIPSKLLPLLGSLLGAFNETAYSIGKAVIKITFIACGGGALLFLLHKTGLLK